MVHDHFAYAFEEAASTYVKKILINIPRRWGRMPPLSRAVVVETGLLLQSKNLLTSSLNQQESNRTIGLIGGSRWGSHSTDIAFAETMRENPSLASPALFGYTLANIPLAEAANHFGLTGPVYAVIDQKDPLAKACAEADRLLLADKSLDMMLACEFDAYYRSDSVDQISVTFTLLIQHD